MSSWWRESFPQVHQAALASLVLAVLLARFHHLWLMNVNWDEFLYLAKVHAFARGELGTAFQSFHVQLFRWLPTIEGTEIPQVLAARVTVFGMTLIGCACVFMLAFRLLGRTGAWFSLLAAVTFSYVLRHGESFRADPLITTLFLASVTLLVLKPASLPAVIAAATALALAMVISVKSVFFVPAVVAIFVAAWLHPGLRPGTAGRFAVYSATALGAWAALYTIHAHLVASGSIGATVGHVAGIGQRMLTGPRLDYLHTTLTADWAYWIMLTAGIVIAARQALRSKGDSRYRAIVMLGLALPLASLLVYRNTFPYFYVTLVPAASVLCGLTVTRVDACLARRRGLATALIATLAVPLAATAVSFHIANHDDSIAPQRQLIGAVHGMFPEPVPYIDRCSMIAAFPKAGMFMSTFVMTAYRESRKPVFEDIVRDRQPVFVLANVAGLDLDRRWDDERGWAYRLLPEDLEFLQAQYVHHWGPIWVAGKSLTARSGRTQDFEITVSGRYTVETGGEVIVDGTVYRGGDVIGLGTGMHSIRSPGADKAVTLRYGDHLRVPGDPPSEAPLFLGLR